MGKIELREKYLKVREKVEDKELRSLVIFNKLLKMPELIKASNIGIYYSAKDEVETVNMIEILVNVGKNVYVPRIREDFQMDFVRYDKNNLFLNKYNIVEVKGDDIINPKDLEIIIIPGVVFDKELNRIGYGKAYYDRYLVNATNAYKVGLTYADCIVDKIDAEDSDIKMDIVLSE
ncbi:MAG: 5-formyltetrahydrofolate cyclo-ligase [Gammaproteobacteria bacterium]|nr:5-formyltetrahydrofolate cyclo-ligase [Gammaproteobacteria bacterium]